MNDAIDRLNRIALSRRDALRALSCGFGMLALRGLGSASPLAAENLLAAKAPMLPARAKRVIFLCMTGAPSHVDTFDYKPVLNQSTGKTLSGYRKGAKLLGSPWQFRQHGKSGLWLSELFPQLAAHADDLCLLRGMHTDLPAHPQAQTMLHTGSIQFVRPSMGAWTLYGLGTENTNLPGFVTMNPQGGRAQLYGSAFLPATYQGLKIGTDGQGRRRFGQEQPPVEDIKNPRQSAKLQRKQLDLVQRLNEEYSKREKNDDGIEAVIESYELAYRMQSELPDLMDLAAVKPSTLEAYGIGKPETDKFGRQCLTALHLAKAGVRFIEVGAGGWDTHRNMREDLAKACTAVDQPIAALLADLKRSSMLDETLVLWGGEFGRTPYAQGDDGRDHNNRGFTTWMAGGGVKGGFSYGATDELGIEAVEGRLSIHDWHATILHLMGLDHERLTFNYAGRDFRLTDVSGEVAREILA
ncbi:MAG: DUF1501 domain-containing protein [Planctomycetes bacterium]|nr:DUF1501 domain-containing protein [Planctomycetota bacterium]MCB9909813.1 DUF1501 domain-containing protein [Planctomycetota bacterium]MCB9912278.1 DUF1501 domain-containing protein [Planctomycetota bacterium]HPF12920.1 DUF1501 domain-containing protein [Planctomycetota bacterium]